jgi:hypothetical protein
MNGGQAADNSNGEIVRFRTNIPVEIPGIKYPRGRPVHNQYGDQVLITFVDGRKAYLPSIVDERIEQLGLKLGEPFAICKREVTEGRRKMIRWDVQRTLADQLQASIDQAQDNRGGQQTSSVPQNQTPRQVNSAPAAATPISQEENQIQSNPTPAPKVSANGMANALRFAIDAAVEATAYAQSKGLAVAFDSDAIRTLAVTVFINAQGGHR